MLYDIIIIIMVDIELLLLLLFLLFLQNYTMCSNFCTDNIVF